MFLFPYFLLSSKIKGLKKRPYPNRPINSSKVMIFSFFSDAPKTANKSCQSVSMTSFTDMPKSERIMS
ncbi:hypothetical protein EGX80_09065 [Streptococcus pyogenes]|uniref:Uncharacterized protein n=2 Tax=Streptococcus pyogenes TaxID=1314 RepID=A0A5S4TMK1_STRPY|nr:hypothetical protein SpyM3_0721 [Streptococcus phage 315.1]AAM79328.1 hypothetical protein - phage-associated [Streptococcus pyogenes MGAS315]AIG47407.1 hypothetical protein STAB902_06160 [Streptococcus pyogenes STAB902]AYZ10198.1 hypothetical protein EGX80_09065 [Streptococcus pyogenes]PWO31932.1 hypothetical protein DJ560_05615 [Streptococcus pyogenes]QBB27758.1 hypothetical protein DZN22_05765 [Streptococcus pyogenes]